MQLQHPFMLCPYSFKNEQRMLIFDLNRDKTETPRKRMTDLDSDLDQNLNSDLDFKRPFCWYEIHTYLVFLLV